MIQATAEKTTRQDDAHLPAPSATPEPTPAVAAIAGDPVNATLEALADVVCEALGDGAVVENGGDSLSVFAGERARLKLNARGDAEEIAGNMEADMRALAQKLTASADAIHEAERERYLESRTLEGDAQTMRDAIDQHLAREFTLEIADDDRESIRLSVNLQRTVGWPDKVEWSVAKRLRECSAKLGAAASAIEEAFGEKPGVMLYEGESGIREIHAMEFDDVFFTVASAESKAAAFARVREFMAALKGCDLAE